jgi:hypothetical protein
LPRGGEAPAPPIPFGRKPILWFSGHFTIPVTGDESNRRSDEGRRRIGRRAPR